MPEYFDLAKRCDFIRIIDDNDNFELTRPITVKEWTEIPPDDFYYWTKEYVPTLEKGGWKLHLYVAPTMKEKTTKEVSEFLQKIDVEHKVAEGGEGGKGMTIYPGSFAKALKISKLIEEKFKGKVFPAPADSSQKKSEVEITSLVAGRFFMQSLFERQYPLVKGICPANRYSGDSRKLLDDLYQEGMISKEIQNPYFEVAYLRERISKEDYHTIATLDAYASHKLYSKYLGDYYHGGNEETMARVFFGEDLPEEGSSLRKKWDKIAENYIKNIEKTNVRGIEGMKKIKTKYNANRNKEIFANIYTGRS